MVDDALRRAPVGVIETRTDGRITDANDLAAETLEMTPDELRGADILERFPKSAAGTLRSAFDGEAPTEESFEEYYPRLDRWLAVDVRVGETVLVYVRDRTDRLETEQRLERFEQRLERVQRINRLVAAVLRQVIDAEDRVDVARTVCERLGGTDLYRFAWVGERDFPDARLRTLATGGDAPDLREEIEDALESELPVPEQQALETGDTRLVGAVADDEALPRGVRRAAFGHGIQSSLAVPLAYQGTVYGVVSVYSGREDGFSEQERVGIETLGSVAGFAVKATRQEDLLVSDTVTEVTIAVSDETVPFVRAAAETGCSLSLDAAVPRGDGSLVCYLAPDEPVEGLEEALSDETAVADVRWIRSGEEMLAEVTLDGETPVTALAAWGATVGTAEYTAESARLVAEAPPDGDVRRLVEAVDATADQTELVAREETSRTADSPEAFRDALEERLTDRQRTVLRTAHLSDYFASPRGSTSAEVAETLDIAGSTMLYHLRRAEQELVTAFFETETDRDPDSTWES